MTDQFLYGFVAGIVLMTVLAAIFYNSRREE